MANTGYSPKLKLLATILITESLIVSCHRLGGGRMLLRLQWSESAG